MTFNGREELTMAKDNYGNAFEALGDASEDRRGTGADRAEANDLARAQVHATLALVDELRAARERNTVSAPPNLPPPVLNSAVDNGGAP